MIRRSRLAQFALAACLGTASGLADPVKVEIKREEGRFQLYRGGRPYFIKGAVYVGDQKDKFPLSGIVERGPRQPSHADGVGRQV